MAELEDDRGNEVQVDDAGESGTPVRERNGGESRSDLRSQIEASFAEVQKRDEPNARQAAAAKRARDAEGTGRFAPNENDPSKKANGAAVETRQPSDRVSSDGKSPEAQAQPASPAQAASAPSALSKDVRDLWPTLDPRVQAEFVRREEDSAKGVAQLKERYRPIEDALAPVRTLLQQRGLSEGQAVKQLFDWHHALAGPNKVQAAHALLRAHGIDPSTFGAPQQPGASQDPRTPQQDPIHPALQNVAQRLETMEQHRHRETADRVTSHLTSFAKDKPHFEKVRVAMAQMIQGGYASDLDDAYSKAIWASPEIRAEIQREEQERASAEAAQAEQAKRAKDEAEEAERKRKDAERLEKARRAGVSPRGTSPTGPIAKAQQGKSVGDSLREAIRESSGAI